VVTVRRRRAAGEAEEQNAGSGAPGGQLYVSPMPDTHIDSARACTSSACPTLRDLSPICTWCRCSCSLSTAVSRGTDVDKPRNLAKSVTVRMTLTLFARGLLEQISPSAPNKVRRADVALWKGLTFAGERAVSIGFCANGRSVMRILSEEMHARLPCSR